MLGTCIYITLLHAYSKVKPQKLINSLLFATAISVNIFGAFYASPSHAVTNVAGVEIEIITETLDGDLVVDPVQDFLGVIETDDSTQLSDEQGLEISGDLWSRIKDGYAMPNIQSPYTSNHETWYAARPEYIQRMLERSQRYLFHIVEEVEKRGIPTEIALLPMIESAFNPQAYSRSKASGIWQFIPSTGKSFGLQQNWWVDNRRDVTAATNAALTYLQKLHGMFGTWDLALAAYNAGEGTVQRAINKNRSKGLPTDYQSLSLPPETRNYVPKLQAIKNILTHPERFGLQIKPIPNRAYFARVTTPKQIDAKLAAELAEISFEEFSSLNPSYNRPVITATSEKHQLLLPVWAAERFATNLANYDKPLTNWQTYNAKRGERMDNIAQKFSINVGQLRNINGLSSSNKVRISQPILVPISDNNQTIAMNDSVIDVDELAQNSVHNIENASEPNLTRPVIYKVKKGDTLQALAKKHGTTSEALIKLNQLNSSKINIGQSIQLTQAKYASAKANNINARKIMKVKHGTPSKKKSSHRLKTQSNIRFR